MGVPSDGVIQNGIIGEIVTAISDLELDDFLECDGALYSIDDYPQLTQYFVDIFGSARHFCLETDTDLTKFRVPNMRTRYLRGVDEGHNTGDYLESALPDVYGQIGYWSTWHLNHSAEGAFKSYAYGSQNSNGGSSDDSRYGTFNASNGSIDANGNLMASTLSPYGISEEVRPNSINVKFYIRHRLSIAKVLSERMTNLNDHYYGESILLPSYRGLNLTTNTQIRFENSLADYEVVEILFKSKHDDYGLYSAPFRCDNNGYVNETYIQYAKTSDTGVACAGFRIRGNANILQFVSVVYEGNVTLVDVIGYKSKVPKCNYNVGDIILYAGTEVPEGWALCDGSLIDKNNKKFAKLYDFLSPMDNASQSLYGMTGWGTDDEQYRLPNLTNGYVKGIGYMRPINIQKDVMPYDKGVQIQASLPNITGSWGHWEAWKVAYGDGCFRLGTGQSYKGFSSMVVPTIGTPYLWTLR